MPETVADYEDAVRRIVRADVSPESTSQREILEDLRDAEAPQITEEIARDIAESTVSEERVIEAIEASGEIPSAPELAALTNVADDYDLTDRQDAVLDAVRDRVATTGDLERAIERDRPLTEREAAAAVDGIGKEIRGADRQEVVDSIVTVEDVTDRVDPSSSSEPVFREDVENVADDMALDSRVGDSEERLDAVTDAASREIGAPSREEFNRARTQALGGSTDYVTPNELGVSDRKSQIGVVRDESGDAVGVVGGTNADDRRGVADELGADRVFDDLNELQDSMGLEQRSGEAYVTLDGQRLREVDVE